MIIQIAEAKALLKEIKEANESLQWKNEMKIRELESIIKKKDQAIADLNSSLFKVTQESMDKDKTIEVLQKDINGIKIKSITEIVKYENELSELRKANTEMAKRSISRYFENKRLKEELKKPKSQLEVGKWYDARTFEVEKLKELLPAGTRVAITTNLSEDEQRIREPKNCIGKTIVTKVAKTIGGTAFYVIRYQKIENYWFKIIEED